MHAREASTGLTSGKIPRYRPHFVLSTRKYESASKISFICLFCQELRAICFHHYHLPRLLGECIKSLDLLAKHPLAIKTIISSSALEPSKQTDFSHSLWAALMNSDWAPWGFGIGSSAASRDAVCPFTLNNSGDFSYPSQEDVGPAAWRGDILVSSSDVLS